MIAVAPSTSFEATLELGVSGLVGTLELGIYDGDTATQALASTSINEIGTSGVYVATRTAPGTAGQYVLIWSQDGSLDPDQVITEDLLVTANALSLVVSGQVYVTGDQLKEILGMQGETYADLAIDIAVLAASRACDGYRRTRFYATSEARIYSPPLGASTIPIDDLSSLTSVTVDMDGDGVFETTWELGTDFDLSPTNAGLDGYPYRALTLRRRNEGAWDFPRYSNSVKVTGSFGWAEAPDLVVQATVLIANFLLSSTQGAPMGVLVEAAGDAIAMARLGRIHPAAAGLLDLLPGEKPKHGSLQLA